MLFLVISLTLLALTIIGFYVFVCLWTYHDAKVRSDKPVIWTLIVLFLPFPYGLIVYLLVGRNKGSSPRKFKIPMIAFAVSILVACVLVIASALIPAGSSFPRIDGISMGEVKINTLREWNVSYKTSGGNIDRPVILGDSNLSAFSASSSCVQGRIFLTITQGETSKTIEITGFDNVSVDLSDFEPGWLTLSLHNDKAVDASILLKW